MKCSVEETEAERVELLQHQTTGKEMEEARMAQKLKQKEEKPHNGQEGDYRRDKGIILINDKSEASKEDERFFTTPKRDSPGWISVSRRK